MTWAWAIAKFTTTTISGIASANPVGWILGIPFSQATVLYSESKVDDHDLDFYYKVIALGSSQWATEYRNGLFFGIAGEVAAKGVGVVCSSVTGELGKEAAKEIAKNGGKHTTLARELISNGKGIAESEAILTAVLQKSGWVGKKEDICDAFALINQMMNDSGKEGGGFFEEIGVLLNEIREVIIWEERDDLDNIQKEILKINRQNISVYMKEGKNYNQHWKINEIINELLRSLAKKRRDVMQNNKTRQNGAD